MRQPWQTVDGKSWILATLRQASGWVSGPEACALLGGLMLVWAVGGRSIRLSETWQLVIGIGMILATFALALLIQNEPQSEIDSLSPLQGAAGGRPSTTWGTLLTASIPAFIRSVELDAEASPR